MRLPLTITLLTLLFPLTSACLSFYGTEKWGYLDAQLFDNPSFIPIAKCQFDNLLNFNREEWIQCQPGFYSWMNLKSTGGRIYGVVAYAYNGMNFRFNVDSEPSECIQWGEGGRCIRYSWALCARVYGCPTGCLKEAMVMGEGGRLGNGTVWEGEVLPVQNPSMSTQWVGDEPDYAG